MIATNNLPTISDRTKATFERLLLIPFKREIPVGRRDRTLDQQLENEIEGILKWSVEGAHRLIEQGGEFTEPQRSIAYLRTYQREQNPMLAFIDECLLRDQASAVPLVNLAKAFNRYNGTRLSLRAVTGMLRASLGETSIKPWRVKDGQNKGSVVKAVVGRRLADQTPELLTDAEYEQLEDVDPDAAPPAPPPPPPTPPEDLIPF